MQAKKRIVMHISFAVTIVISSVIAHECFAQSNAEKLRAHSEEFRKEVIRVTDGVHVAVGYALANSILIEGDDGVIIVDTTESQTAAKEILEKFREITDKPVVAIVYTHFHADHIMGAQTFAASGDAIQVVAHEGNAHYAKESYGMLRPIILARSIRQFGVMLSAKDRPNDGIGPRLRIGIGAGLDSYIEPTVVVGSDPMELTISGVRMKFVHAPGETDDQLYVWLPDKKVLLPGDNFYRSFPNLYAIRGTKYRDVRQWANSLDLMLSEEAEFLVPSHTRPIVGQNKIRERLQNYRDAIRFVHDETVKGVNEGLTPDELVERIELPDHLQEDPWLVEYYGTMAWSIRNIYNGYLGWFDGNPTNLNPLSKTERAKRMATLLGGTKKMKVAAQKALDSDDAQWCLELTDWVKHVTPDDEENQDLRKSALRALADGQISANGRNYYLTSVQQGL